MDAVTVRERKRRNAERLTAAARAVIFDLSAFAGAHPGGRFIVFGSVADGEICHDSDFDVIVDFPPLHEDAAWRAVEDSCERHAIRPDVLPASKLKDGFLQEIMRSSIRIIP
jgi:predicted nucleotidyltransferase